MRAYSRLKLKSRGFTLIELMIVVAIVGVLAALAIYGVRKYLLNSKTAEAKNAVGQMAKDATAAYERESMPSGILDVSNTAEKSNSLCTEASSPIPATAPSGAKFQSSPAMWNADSATPGKGFACLKFSMTDPQYYSYNYSSASSIFTAQANGDLDGNGTTSTFILSGDSSSGFVRVAPNFYIVNEEE